MFIRKLTAATAAAGALALAGPLAGASAASVPPSGGPVLPPLPGLTFIPPHVGPICATIGPIIIGGMVINPGLDVCTTGTSLPPLQRAA